MDPNETLKRIRVLIAAIVARTDFEPGRISQAEYQRLQSLDGEELAGAMQNLDRWISKGGFLPSDWRSTSKLQQCVICKRMKLVCCSDRRAPLDQCVNPRCFDCCKHETRFNIVANQNNRGE